jgi:RNA polymerase sigma factor (sigma-70 family)
MNPIGQIQQPEHAQVLQCLQGDDAALAGLREKYNGCLANILRARGASATETEELLADMWGDCVARNDERPSLLEKFSGKCSLQGWLATVTTRRWIDLKRRQTRRGEHPLRERDGEESDPLERLAAAATASADDTLVSLLRDSLQAAFASCSREDLLMLRLVFVHGLSQREVMRMWGWSESRVSRRLSRAMAHIEEQTLEKLKQMDPWLDLTWQDFVDLCDTHQIGFL